MTTIRGLFKILLFTVWTICLVILQLSYGLIQKLCRIEPVRQSPVVRLWYAGVTQILNIRVTFKPVSLSTHQQYLYMANHTSYIDIFVLGALLPPYFVAKSDIADWPIFGFLSKLGGTIFISRKRSLVKKQMAVLTSELKHGKHLLLFPEGTTSSGQLVLPFKSSLLHIIYDEPGMPDIQIVPVCINYTAVNGADFPDGNKDMIAWYADMTMGPHLWNVFKLKSIDVTVTLSPAFQTAGYTDAKQLTKACEVTVRQVFDADSQSRCNNAVK